MSALFWLPASLHLAYAALVWRLGDALATPGRLLGPRGAGREVEPEPSFSVLIAARNEEERIGATLRSLREQTLPATRWEVLVVDDGSRDATTEQARSALDELRAAGIQGRLLEAQAGPGGKKRALERAQQAARFPWAAVLDADCRPSPGWLAALAEAVRPDLGLLAGPVVFEGATRFARLARLEYAGVLGAGLASFGLGRPLYASGANLCWRREAYREAGGYQGLEEIASADDTLLIQRLRLRTNWGQAALLDPRARVLTRAPGTLREFWHQRVRWTSTERHMPDRGALAAALALYLVFLGCLLAPLGWLAGFWSGWFALVLPGLKLIPDLRLVHRAAGRLGIPWQSRDFLVVWLGQLAYGLAAPWFGLSGRLRWRESA